MIPKPKRRTKYARWKERDKREFAGYIDWLSHQACAVCGEWPVQMAHLGNAGMSAKTSFGDCIPLCRVCHLDGPQAYHKLGKRWYDVHGFEKSELVTRYHTLCRSQSRAAV